MENRLASIGRKRRAGHVHASRSGGPATCLGGRRALGFVRPRFTLVLPRQPRLMTGREAHRAMGSFVSVFDESAGPCPLVTSAHLVASELSRIDGGGFNGAPTSKYATAPRRSSRGSRKSTPRFSIREVRLGRLARTLRMIRALPDRHQAGKTSALGPSTNNVQL